MLFQVGGQGTRPTFFEMAATQQLPSSLRAALAYSIGVLAQRQPVLHKVLDYEDEFFALLMLVLDTHSLRTTDASFAESLYGLRRKAVKISTRGKDVLPVGSRDGVKHAGLERHQKVLSLAFLVVLPYVKSKLHLVYTRQRNASLQATLWGQGDVGADDVDHLLQEQFHLETENVDSGHSDSVSGVTRLKKIVASLYPWLHAVNEGFSFAYQLLYLLDATGFYTPALHILGIHVCRATGQELMDSSSRIARSRTNEYQRLRGPAWLKMMEWWYQSAEERMSAPTVYPPPPPPPPPKVAEGGISLPPDRSLCPLCTQKRANPSVVSVSGFVFCYACIFKYVSQYKRCPITLMPVNIDQIRRLFHDA
ncbi:peroxisome biogenesis protein 12 isoform X2 [Nymphaea colorata]|uniref:peroxisome biogenesis protein 12 isoform X2 n=1 Tax=Nymphaea colorata TaxID=210225 RepID=UPI00129E7F4B|nr:peroxisome biogenesis protein 12 isoform X2 [Nymphaea colorata]